MSIPRQKGDTTQPHSHTHFKMCVRMRLRNLLYMCLLQTAKSYQTECGDVLLLVRVRLELQGWEVFEK